MKLKKKIAPKKSAKRSGKRATTILWPNPGKSGTYTSSAKVSVKTGRVIANTTVTLNGALTRLAYK